MRIVIIVLCATVTASSSPLDQSDKNALKTLAQCYAVGGVGAAVVGQNIIQEAQEKIAGVYEKYKKMDIETAYCKTSSMNKFVYDYQKLLLRGQYLENASNIILCPIVSVVETMFLPVTIPKVYKELYKQYHNEFSGKYLLSFVRQQSRHTVYDHIWKTTRPAMLGFFVPLLLKKCHESNK